MLANLSSSHDLLTKTSSILSCGIPHVPERVAQVIDDRKKAEKRVEDVEMELAGLIAQNVAEEIKALGLEGKHLVAVHKHRTDDSTAALGFLSTVSSAIGSTDFPYLIVLSSSPSSQTSNSTSVVLILGADDKLVKEAGERLKWKLGVKGGGKGNRWSGKFIGVWKDARENLAIEDMLKDMSSVTP